MPKEEARASIAKIRRGPRKKRDAFGRKREVFLDVVK